MRGLFKKIWNVFTTLAVLVVVVLALALVGIRVIGLTPYTVLSGSMEPAYKVGSLIYVREIEPEEIKVGDAITFVLNEDLVVATHRVIEIDKEKQHFYTKGDANEAEDGAPVHFNNLLGKPEFSIPYLGYLANYLTNPPGMYMGISIALVLVMLLFMPDILRKVDESDKKKKAGVNV